MNEPEEVKLDAAGGHAGANEPFSRPVTDYLYAFFQALERLKPQDSWGVTHGMSYHRGALYILISLGDARVRVPFKEFEANPVRAAENAVHQWKNTSWTELEQAIEG